MISGDRFRCGFLTTWCSWIRRLRTLSPAEVKRAVDLIAATEAQRAAPCYIAYNSDREEALLESFEDSMRIGRALGYKSVKENTQAKIHLYGPKV